MFGIAMNSAKLLFTGKLFQDNRKVLRQFAIGAGAGGIVTVVVAQFTMVWLAAMVGGAVCGFLQPILFKDLKYA